MRPLDHRGWLRDADAPPAPSPAARRTTRARCRPSIPTTPRINLPVPAGSDEVVWLSLIEHLIVPIGLEFRPELVLISAGFDAHERDPLGGCRLQSDSFAQMACDIREMAEALPAPIGAVLEGGYHLKALAESVPMTIAALSGAGEAMSIAPDPILTPRIASHLAHRWTL